MFGEWNLSVNDSKSEHLHFYLAQPKPQNRKKLVPGVGYRGDEPWRKHKVLGSILCSVEDVKKKCILGNVAYANFKNVWSKNNIYHLTVSSRCMKHRLSPSCCTTATAGQPLTTCLSTLM